MKLKEYKYIGTSKSHDIIEIGITFFLSVFLYRYSQISFILFEVAKMVSTINAL